MSHFSIPAKLPQPAHLSKRCSKLPQAPRCLSTVARPQASKIIVFRPRNGTGASRRYSAKPISDAELDATAAAAAAASAAARASSSSGAALDWNTFFALRKTRRRWQLGFSVVTAFLFGCGGSMVLFTGVAEPLVDTGTPGSYRHDGNHDVRFRGPRMACRP